MKQIALLAAAIALSACQLSVDGTHAPATTAVHQAPVQFSGVDATLTGELFLPAYRDKRNPRHPGIILMHGCSGMYNERGQLTGRHQDWAQRFTEWGFVVLLVDSLGPRGLGPLCELKERAVSPWKERNLDAYAALEYLVARTDIDRKNVFVMGWSNGGTTVTGAVRSDAPGRRADGPRFKAAIAYYPSCKVPLRQKSYRPTVPLLIQHGEADDWTPATACVELAKKMKRQGIPVETIIYPDACHGFDAPSSKLRFFPNVYNPNAPGEHGAHIGGHEPSRMKAIADTKRFIDQQLAR